MKKLFIFLGIIFGTIAVIGTANLFTALVFSYDMCFFTFSPVSELSEGMGTFLGIGTIASFPLAIMFIGFDED